MAQRQDAGPSRPGGPGWGSSYGAVQQQRVEINDELLHGRGGGGPIVRTDYFGVCLGRREDWEPGRKGGGGGGGGVDGGGGGG